MQVVLKKFENGGLIDASVNLNTLPDYCPICNNSAQLNYIVGFSNKDKFGQKECMQAIFQCPRNACKRYCIAYYKADDSNLRSYTYAYCLPKTQQPKIFPSSINEISPEFVLIYNQALIAEGNELDKIVGVGFRKALEFLIKDYSIIKNPDDENSIKAMNLSDCINKYITDKNIKSVSKRAIWLGNDETHYVRKWSEKDIADLKILIDLTVYWMDSEVLTAKLEEDMPSE